jgi:hypothetical protein
MVFLWGSTLIGPDRGPLVAATGPLLSYPESFAHFTHSVTILMSGSG